MHRLVQSVDCLGATAQASNKCRRGTVNSRYGLYLHQQRAEALQGIGVLLLLLLLTCILHLIELTPGTRLLLLSAARAGVCPVMVV